MVVEKEVHMQRNFKIRIALKMANERQNLAKEILNQILAHLVLTIPSTMSSNKALKKEDEALRSQLKAK